VGRGAGKTPVKRCVRRREGFLGVLEKTWRPFRFFLASRMDYYIVSRFLAETVTLANGKEVQMMGHDRNENVALLRLRWVWP